MTHNKNGEGLGHALASILPDIERAARRTSDRWSDVIDADDLTQEIALRLLEDRYATQAAQLDPAARADVLNRIGVRIASEHRDDFDVFSGQWHYGTDEVRRLLDSGVLDEREETVDVERMDAHAGLLRLSEANPGHSRIIGEVYLRREPVGGSTRRKHLQRAIESLTRHMNRAHRDHTNQVTAGPGSRQVLTNDQAQALTGKHY
ncbi:hypothetical protein JOD54_002145 [Actinokineospora baliensis]|uniref:hypothetical protein n=1 Tax=Actinokineospora baliensis TaxID=547056 RepID=UPI001959A735|nr:hypothetical protein [Actinokineospora baliensis]MBM7771941.1 hypothetical protein [Actinokineospora baliensis]